MSLTTVCIALAVKQASLGPFLVRLTESDFRISQDETGAEQWISVIEPKGYFDQAVVSWQLDSITTTGLEVFVQPLVMNAKLYSLGFYEVGGARYSVNQQDDEVAKVSTDTLILAAPTDRLRVIVRPKKSALGNPMKLRALRVMLSNTQRPPEERPAKKEAWGKVVEPPRRAQMSYPGGGVLCSPTSVSMILGYWGDMLGKRTMDEDVPLVQKGVFDPGYHGTGNWSFNVAHAGLRPELVSYVSRFRDLRDLEEFTYLGIPIVCSIHYPTLKGVEPWNGDTGHLVVVSGFDANGDPVLNDPGRNEVRMTYPRQNFIQAWAKSQRTVYVIHPRNFPTPKTPGPWDNGAIQP